MKYLPALIILIFILYGCVDDKPVNKIMNEQSDQIKTYKYLALGDSYTIGESVSENERWPIQLRDSLSSFRLKVDTKIIAKTGWTTDELDNGIDDVMPSIDYDLVSLLIGVNNQYRGRSRDEFRSEFNALLIRSVNFADSKKENVFVLSIPDWGVTPFAQGRDRDKITNEIDEFNKVIEEECLNQNVKYFDITDISRLAAEDKSLLAADGLHPSGKMYSKWVERILPSVKLKLLDKD